MAIIPGRLKNPLGDCQRVCGDSRKVHIAPDRSPVCWTAALLLHFHDERSRGPFHRQVPWRESIRLRDPLVIYFGHAQPSTGQQVHVGGVRVRTIRSFCSKTPSLMRETSTTDAPPPPRSPDRALMELIPKCPFACSSFPSLEGERGREECGPAGAESAGGADTLPRRTSP